MFKYGSRNKTIILLPKTNRAYIVPEQKPYLHTTTQNSEVCTIGKLYFSFFLSFGKYCTRTVCRWKGSWKYWLFKFSTIWQLLTVRISNRKTKKTVKSQGRDNKKVTIKTNLILIQNLNKSTQNFGIKTKKNWLVGSVAHWPCQEADLCSLPFPCPLSSLHTCEDRQGTGKTGI